MCEFISQCYTTLSWGSLLAQILWNLRSDILDIVESHGESWKNLRQVCIEAFSETSLAWVNSAHRVTSLFSLRSLLKVFSQNLQWDTRWRSETTNNLSSKKEGCFLRNCFVMCAFNSLSYSCISWNSLLALFLWNLRTDISDPFEDYRAKGNILW